MASTKLLEHILNGDYVSANDTFNERMVELQEQKLYEAKQIVAAEMNEVFMSKGTKEKLKKGYRFITPQERERLTILPKGERDKKTPVKRDPSSIAPSKVKTTKKTPGIIRRNVNTLMGHKPGYVKPETPADEKGGRVGKALRTAGKALGFAGRVAASMAAHAE